jgi:hypothetical protein
MVFFPKGSLQFFLKKCLRLLKLNAAYRLRLRHVGDDAVGDDEQDEVLRTVAKVPEIWRSLLK